MTNYKQLLQDSIFERKNLNNFISKKFQIELISISPLGGYSNINYCIIDKKNNQYVCRIALHRTYQSLINELHVLKCLKLKNLTCVPEPIDFQNMQYRGKCFWVNLFKKIPGYTDGLWWQLCTIEKIPKIFCALAQLHDAMAEIPVLPKNKQIRKSYQIFKSIPSFRATREVGSYVRQNWIRFYDSACRLQRDMKKYFPWKKARYQWIHGDIQLENILFDQDEVAAFIDFEHVNWDACEKDVIFSAFRLSRSGKRDQSFEYDKNYLNLAMNEYLKKSSHLCNDFFSLYDELWKFYYCLDQSMLYLKNAVAKIWTLDEEIGFLPCFKEVMLYRNL